MVPDIDKHIGIYVYSTPTTIITANIANIRDGYDSFIVEEVIDLGSLSISDKRDSVHRYPLFRLIKRGIDTTHALREVQLKYNIRLKALGLKDASALTTQYAIASKSTTNNDKVLLTKHCRLELIGYTDVMLSKRHLLGNIFHIRFKLRSKSIMNNIVDMLDTVKDYVKERRIANFYGYQRFGSARAVTHLVGKAIVKRAFNDAVNTLLTYTTEYESSEHKSIRIALMSNSLSKDLVESMPDTMDIERAVARELLKSNDPIRALRALPVEVRRLFVEAYQAYIFNRTLSNALINGYDISRVADGDVCFIMHNGRLGDIRVADAHADNAIVAVPLVGYASRLKGRFGMLMQNVLKDEGISIKDFYIKEMQEVSIEGGFRPAPLLLLSDMKYDIIDDDSISLSFGLHKGSYATILLREVIKPSNPPLQGF